MKCNFPFNVIVAWRWLQFSLVSYWIGLRLAGLGLSLSLELEFYGWFYMTTHTHTQREKGVMVKERLGWQFLVSIVLPWCHQCFSVGVALACTAHFPRISDCTLSGIQRLQWKTPCLRFSLSTTARLCHCPFVPFLSFPFFWLWFLLFFNIEVALCFRPVPDNGCLNRARP